MYLMEVLAVLVKDWQENLEAGTETVSLDHVARLPGGNIHCWIMPDLAPAMVADLIMGGLDNIGMLEAAEEKASGYQNSAELRADLNLLGFLMELRDDAMAGHHFAADDRLAVAGELPAGF